MNCSKCQREVSKGMEFCDYCGTPVPQKKKKNKAPLLIGIIIGIIVIAVAGVLLFSNTGTTGYDNKVEKGYELLKDGKYEEAIREFDKAIKIDEKRPEGYMGKSESMAHDPNMTPEKAEEIVRVLEEGYKKSGDEKVLKHKEKIGKILREKGFEVEAGIVEGKDVSEAPAEKVNDFVVADCVAVANGKLIMIEKGEEDEDGFLEKENRCLKVVDIETGEIDYFFKNKTPDAIFCSDGKKIYTMNLETKDIMEVDIETKTEKVVAKASAEMQEQATLSILGCGNGYLYIGFPGFRRAYIFAVNLETGDLWQTDIGSQDKCVESRFYTYGKKAYFMYDGSLCKMNPDGSEIEELVGNIILDDIWFNGNKVYYSQITKEDTSYDNSTSFDEGEIMKVVSYNIDTGESTTLKENITQEVYFTNFGFGYETDGNSSIIQHYNGTEKKIEGTVKGTSSDCFYVEKNKEVDAYLLFEDKKTKASEKYLDIKYNLGTNRFFDPCYLYSNGILHYMQRGVMNQINVELE